MKKIPKIVLSIFLTLFFLSTHAAAKRACAIGGINFGCPSKYFPEVKVESKEVRIFRYKEPGDDLFFFISVPTGSFEPDSLTGLVYSKDLKSGGFNWTVESKPLLMDFETKHKPDIAVWLGFNETKLVEVKAFRFEVKDMKFVLGYMSDLSEDPRANAERFRAANGFADNAAGCNQVMTILNTVTKEFKDKDQGCTLTVLGGF